MSYLVLARKWRPQRFSEVIGQRHVVRTLENAIRGGRIAHAYVFSGPRGVGKTSIARILAKSLNCQEGPTAEPCGTCRSCQDVQGGSHFDVIEIDGASNNSVNDIRELRTNVKYGPGESRWKVYIIDEVHMLSTSAFNALLKTLEEPPPNTVFIFATTELHKLPLTVLSRCQRFDFKRLTPLEIEESLARVCQGEGVSIEARTLRLIARRADGGMRDAQSMLDQVLSFSENTVVHEEVVQALGLVGQEKLDELLEFLAQRDSAQALRLARDLSSAGTDLAEFLLQLADSLRHLLLVQLDPQSASDLPEDALARLQELAPSFTQEELIRMLGYLGGQIEAIRKGGHPRLRFELTLLRLVRMERSMDVQDVLRALAGLPVERLEIPGGTALPATEEKKTLIAPAVPEPPVPAPPRPAQPVEPRARRAVSPPAEPASSVPPPIGKASPESAPCTLEDARRLWPALQTRVAEELPLLIESFRQLLPVELEAGRLVLKGEVGQGLMAERLEKERGRLENLFAELLGSAGPSFRFREGVLEDHERFLDTRRTHLDARSRFEELKRESPLVEDLFTRMDGKLLDS